MPRDVQNRSIYIPQEEWDAINAAIPQFCNRNTYVRLVLKWFATMPGEVMEQIKKHKIEIPAYKRRRK